MMIHARGERGSRDVWRAAQNFDARAGWRLVSLGAGASGGDEVRAYCFYFGLGYWAG